MATTPASDVGSEDAVGIEGLRRLEQLGIFKEGRSPVKLVTGQQETTGLNFDLKPGAIVAHPNSTVVFVCG